MLEAMAAGLPIIASDISAHSSFLSHCETGYLLGDNQSLDTLIAQIESPEINKMIGAAARDWAMKNVGTWGDCAERYVSRYRRLLSNSSSD
jgi:glycosyltransferase involved in cell wall biosynthesis